MIKQLANEKSTFWLILFAIPGSNSANIIASESHNASNQCNPYMPVLKNSHTPVFTLSL